MTNNIVTKIETVKEVGAIFASALTTDYIELNNFKYVDFVVTTGAGTSANTTVKILAKNGATGTATAVAFRKKTSGYEYSNISADGETLSIGGTVGSTGKAVYRITADNLAKGGFDRVALSTTAVASSTVNGTVVAVLYEPRYIA